MKASSVTQKYMMSELIGNQKMSPGRIQHLNQHTADQTNNANFIRNQIINSDEERQNSRRILSELGTVQLTKNQQRDARKVTSSQYIHTDDEGES